MVEMCKFPGHYRLSDFQLHNNRRIANFLTLIITEPNTVLNLVSGKIIYIQAYKIALQLFKGVQCNSGRYVKILTKLREIHV